MLAIPPRHPDRLVYFGTPETAVPPLLALHAAGWHVVLVVTRADKRRGRGSALVASPVKVAALELGIPVSSDPDEALTVGAELGVVVAFGRLIREHVLEELPMINLHFSKLPRWRGAAPVERAILAGDTETAVDIMAVDVALDTGPIYAESVLSIGPDETADELRGRLVAAGTDLLLEVLRDIPSARPQRGEATYADKIDPDELRIDWNRPAVEIHRLVRIGGAWTTFRSKRLKVWRTSVVSQPCELATGEIAGVRIGTGEGCLDLVEVQPEGKGRQPAPAWRNGARPVPGEGFELRESP